MSAEEAERTEKTRLSSRGCYSPLDGFGAVGLLLSEEGAGRFQEMGHRLRGFSFIGLLIAWQVFAPIYDPLFTLSLNVLYPGHWVRDVDLPLKAKHRHERQAIPLGNVSGGRNRFIGNGVRRGVDW